MEMNLPGTVGALGPPLPQPIPSLPRGASGWCLSLSLYRPHSTAISLYPPGSSGRHHKQLYVQLPLLQVQFPHGHLWRHGLCWRCPRREGFLLCECPCHHSQPRKATCVPVPYLTLMPTPGGGHCCPTLQMQKQRLGRCQGEEKDVHPVYPAPQPFLLSASPLPHSLRPRLISVPLLPRVTQVDPWSVTRMDCGIRLES